MEDKRLELLKEYIRSTDIKGAHKRFSDELRQGWNNILIENNLEIRDDDEDFEKYIEEKKKKYLI